MSPRDYHSLSHANDAINREAEFEGSVFRVRPYDGVPDVYIGVPGAAFAARPQWYYNFEYDRELERGLDWSEDLFSHGEFRKTLSAGDRLGVIVSLAPPDGRDAFALMRSEADRRAALLGRLPVRDQFSEVLALAADQFVVRRTGDLETLIAGYHWFTDWGRDTMIALPGICLVTGRFEEALGILTTFARSVSEGMLPNRFPDGGEAPEYNTVDATLCFFVAVYRYFLYTGDEAGMREVFMPVLRDIIRWHDRGTRYNIHITEDGLLYAGEPGVQLTWMDAKVGGLVVTPRKGKAVEVNALWYNALRIYSYLAESLQLPEESFGERAREVREQFEKVFWNERRGALYDCVDGEFRDESVRPNQLFAISLPFPLLEGARAASVLRLIRDELLTPVGLRSLSRDNPAYRPVYIGDQWSRDTAYHQGTVWSWLLGPYVTAVMRISGGAAREEARSLLTGIVPRLAEAGAGTVSEIFDGDAPHSARGCIAQAWSVGEILRAYVEDVLGILPPLRNHGKRPEAAEPNRLQFVDARARPL
jgi:predicted glycogen debranching enzyme